MAQVIRERRYVDDSSPAIADTGNMVARVIYTISGIISALLLLRFVFVLLGANPNNGFADLVYTLSQPLVAPFFGLFNYTAALGTSRFEFETLIALVVYSLIAWVLVRLFSGTRGNYVDY